MIATATVPVVSRTMMAYKVPKKLKMARMRKMVSPEKMKKTSQCPTSRT